MTPQNPAHDALRRAVSGKIEAGEAEAPHERRETITILASYLTVGTLSAAAWIYPSSAILLLLLAAGVAMTTLERISR